jgi:4-oxalocrotonate tautomerase
MPFIDVAVSHDPDPELAEVLTRGISERTSRILGRVFEHTALTVRFVPPTLWFVAGRSMTDLRRATFWLSVRVTRGTTSREQKAAYLAEIFAFMRERLGELHEVSYAAIDEVSADAWGFGGISQDERRLRASPPAAVSQAHA